MLALGLTARYRRLGNLQDLEASLQRMQEAVDLTPADHLARAGRLQGLAVSFRNRYLRLGALEDLEASLQRNQEAVGLTPADHPDRADWLKSLAVTFMDRYQRSGALDDLEAALQKMQEAVDLTPVDHPDRAGRVEGLAVSFGVRYQRLGTLDDLEASLQKMQEAVNLTPADHSNRAERLHNLAVSFRNRCQRLGALEDLEASLQRKQEAVSLTPADHPDRAERLQSLAGSFRDRYQRLGALDDLEAALQMDNEAVSLTPGNHLHKARRVEGLAVSFGLRYQRLGALNDLEATLQKMQEVVDLTLADDPERARRLNNLGVSFTNRYQRLGALNDLEAALQKIQEAVDLAPVDHPGRAEWLQSLAVPFRDRYQRLGALEDLKASLRINQEAVNLTPVDHPARAERLQNLSLSFIDLYHKFQDPQALELIHQNYSESFKTQAPSDPEPSWNAALDWASFSQEFHPMDCCTAYSAAFNLLPELLWMGHTIPVRQDTIRRLNIGHSFCSYKDGVGTTFQQILQLRPDLGSLPKDQAQQLQQLSYELYSGTTMNPTKVAHERNQLLQEIRKQPGLEYFLLPRPYNVLCKASQEGPVVILNSHEDGCDGIIIPNPMADPVAVALPNVTLALLKAQQDDLKQLLSRCNVRTRGESVSTRLFGHREGFKSRKIEECFSDLLTWLWENIVDRVYEVLASLDIHNGRLWWLLTGSFTGLPLHACPPTNQFIHSYTATLGSLLEAREKTTATVPHKIGVVGVTHTGPGNMHYLKGVAVEVKMISSVIKDPNLECLEGENATPDAVKSQLQNCSWVHLACHGVQDLNEPTQSHLLLYNEFVFLAACQTAMGDVDLVNESFHLGGGFIAAGFHGAIGTLWSMNDEDGPLVAETVYSHLFRDGRQPQAIDAAEALHLAVNKLREKKVPYEHWILFIHMGV
ncbi:hypothetical protein DFH07DRAFT_763759 [Mycena maculata]|uniref:CHAT domain-containing protein n=1 Tax=Mycena maculata TaxID=230809 RepID=A0AAD7KI50_9AGAR|nr:hypothetical protein DFH07DRAFT_763759 [Mycena maculata]